MTFRILITITVLWCSTTNLTAQDANLPRIHIGLIYPLSTNWVLAGDQTNLLSFHCIAGISSSEKAFCGSGITSVIKLNANGLIAAGVSNHIGKDASGVQASGVLNTIGGKARGLTAAGFLNITGSAHGLQVAGLGNITHEDAEGMQVAGFMNIANNASSQFSGFINIARAVSGVQMSGFINIAEESDYPIGIINIIKNGSQGLGLTIDEALTTSISLRSGGRVLYGILSAGVNLQQNPEPLYALEVGMGAHMPVTPHFRVKSEISSTTLTDFYRGSHFRGSLRLLPAVTLGQKLEIFAGPTLNYVSFTHDKGQQLIHKYLWSLNRPAHFHGMYFGAIAGAHILL